MEPVPRYPLLDWSQAMRVHGGESYYTIGEVAKAVGVSPQTLRVWERQGLFLPSARSDGGHRLYSDETLRQVGEIAILRRRHGWNPAAIRSSTSLTAQERAWGSITLGIRIRLARRNRGLTLQEAARQIGISRSFLSTLERGESGVSVQILSRIADTLKMPMSAFAPIHPPATTVVRRDERPRTVLEEGVTWEELASPGHQLEPALLIIPPGATSGGPITRPGETFVSLLEGSLAFTLLDDGSEMAIEPGDSLILSPASTWSWVNPGPSDARAFWVEQLAPGAWT
jgi:DNA-binding transcriptional MerR regulator